MITLDHRDEPLPTEITPDGEKIANPGLNILMGEVYRLAEEIHNNSMLELGKLTPEKVEELEAKEVNRTIANDDTFV